MGIPMRITAVSYLNTIPFLYGIRHSGLLSDHVLDLAVPSVCASRLRHGLADVALVPVGAISGMPSQRVVTDYCLGADGPVGSVFLVGGAEPEKIRRVYLDTDSMTSIRLARLLFRDHWRSNPEFISGFSGFDRNNPGDSAAVVIGDKAFDYIGKMPVVLDLSQQWKAFTGLPFVFAVWMALSSVEDGHIRQLNAALAYGISHIREALNEYNDTERFPDAYTYLSERISYPLDANKRKALELFLDRTANF